MSSRYGKRKLSNYIGQIGETLAFNYLREQGFEVMSYMLLVDLSRHLNSKFRRVGTGDEFHPGSIVKIRKFLGSKKGDFLELIETLEIAYSGSEHRRRRFDFIAKKEGKYYVVEVKTNKSILSKLEKKEFEMSKKFGFIPMLVRTKATIIANVKDVTMEIL